MASVREHLQNVAVTSASPDRCIHARVSNYRDVEVWFDPGAYRWYDESALGHQLARLGATTWVAYHRARSEAYRLARGLSRDELAAAERPSEDPRRRRYEQQLNEVEGEGVSAGGVVRVRTRGLTWWSVQIQPGTLHRAGEAAFLREVHSAVAALQADREAKIIMLKSDYFDVGIPHRWRELMDQLRATNRR
jgi:hypothetical protein